MNTQLLALGFIGLALSACAAGNTGSSSDAVVLDVRCDVDTDCPSAFECEHESEHGTADSYCVSYDDSITSSGDCPAGYELEEEHGSTFCKPHGGDDDGSGSGATGGGQACSTDADCGAGLECEVEIEHGVTTSFCKPHGEND